MRFQLGDIVRGSKRGDYFYGVTNSKMKKGVVTKVHAKDDIELIDLRVMVHDKDAFNGCQYHNLLPDCFELCADLQFDASVADEELEKLLFARS